jgi:hypothetical protein
LDIYCPDPKKILDPTQVAQVEQLGLDPRSLLTPEQLEQFYGNAYYIWYYFAAIGLLAFILLLIYRWITNRMDKRHVI